MPRPRNDAKKIKVMILLREDDYELVRAAAFAAKARTPNEWVARVAVAVAMASPDTTADAQ